MNIANDLLKFYKNIILEASEIYLENEENNFSDMDAEKIYNAGINQKQFDFNKGLDALIKADKDGCYIFAAGIKWKQFDFNKGLDSLIKTNKDGYWIYNAGKHWEQFDSKKGLDALKKFPEYYKDALKLWPKGIKQSREEIERLKRTSEKMPSKKFKL